MATGFVCVFLLLLDRTGGVCPVVVSSIILSAGEGRAGELFGDAG